VVLALVAFTYTFVNNLPPAPPPAAVVIGGSTSSPTTTTAATTTTTTLPPEIVTFMTAVDDLSSRAAATADKAQQINDDYDTNVAGYGPTRNALSDFAAQVKTLADDVAAVTVPSSAAAKWEDVKTSIAAMQTAADDMLDGLVKTPGPEKRLSALDDYRIAATTLGQALAAAKAAAAAG